MVTEVEMALATATRRKGRGAEEESKMERLQTKTKSVPLIAQQILPSEQPFLRLALPHSLRTRPQPSDRSRSPLLSAASARRLFFPRNNPPSAGSPALANPLQEQPLEEGRTWGKYTQKIH